ncbi:hypothetical protein ACLB1M_35035 [Escherichia coli]
MKELLFEMQEERRDEWIAENYPDAEKELANGMRQRKCIEFRTGWKRRLSSNILRLRLPVFLTACRMQRLNSIIKSLM